MAGAHPPPITDQQYRLLRSALEQGYFDHPPRTTVLDLAERHDLDREEVVAELRMGLEGVLQATFFGRN